MPPKPRPVRKPSLSSGSATPVLGAAAAAKDSTTTMPPPPAPLGILEPEITALCSCLQASVIKTGEIYGFYTDVKRIGIQQYAPKPPRSLTSALGREIVKYDQLCDAMESHLLRAISVLQRDLAREEMRIKTEQEAAAAAVPKPPTPTPPTAPNATPAGSPTQAQTDPLLDGSIRPRLPSVNIARRQSTISLSSLSRPAAPHKLDLSVSRILPEEMIPTGLSSPVTLAPRSARAPSLPPELVMLDPTVQPTHIDLTLDSDIDMSVPGAPGSHILHGDPTAGSSADRPIELDMDMDMELQFFADNPAGSDASAAMFGPALLSGPDQHAHMIKPKQEEQLDMDLLRSFSSIQHAGAGDDMFASFGNSPPDASSTSTAAQKAPLGPQSPGAILAGLTGTSQQEDGPDMSIPHSLDFDMSFLTGQGSGGDMDIAGMHAMFMDVHSTDTSAIRAAGPSGSGTTL